MTVYLILSCRVQQQTVAVEGVVVSPAVAEVVWARWAGRRRGPTEDVRRRRQQAAKRSHHDPEAAKTPGCCPTQRLP